MRITVMGALIVIGGALLLAYVLNAIQQGSNEPGKNNEQPKSTT